MRVCELCGKELPNQESFCRPCGRTADHGQETPTSISMGNTAIVQETPQFGSVPSVHGTPQMAGDPFVQNPTQGGYPSSAFHSSPTIAVPRYAPTSGPPYAPDHPPIIHGAHYPPHRPPLPHRPPGPYHTAPGGCAPLWLIFLFASIIIISSMISIGLTVLSPSLSLSGGTDVALGDSLHLHGSGFIPVSGVILTLDDTTPLYFTYRSSALQASYATHTMISLALTTVHLGQISSSNNIVVVGIDGSFNVTITIDPSWHTGQHTIRASERIFPRSALITINVHQPAQIPTASSSLVASPSSTPSVNPSPTASPSTTPSGLSCINPTSIALGPVSEGYTEAVSTQVSLCMAGSGTVNWTASWDQNQASWLQLDNSMGDIQAPGQQQINVSALAAKLKPGSYTATVTFSSQQSSTTEALNVTFTVQKGCIHTSQQEYSFTGVAGVSDPQVQTLMVSNCGIVGSWSTAISTNNNVNWLSVAPTSAGLMAGAAQSVTISASNLKTQLVAGTYGGKILFSIGSNQVMVYVTLTVEPGPKIILVSPGSGSFNADKDCTFNSNLAAWICTASISNSSNTLSLTWKSSSSGVSNITFKPSVGTMIPGAGERVEIIIPKNNCQTPTTLTFTGPANAVYISWSCSITP
ncbi:MAG: hypothetical protein ACJ8CB_26885 [Ktedonobacteraceae bacterium]